jgi:hypothetical protein
MSWKDTALSRENQWMLYTPGVVCLFNVRVPAPLGAIETTSFPDYFGSAG